jgi:hypothetical protein
MISFQQTGCIQPTGRAPESDSSERKRSPSAEDPLPAVSCPFMGPILKGLDRPPPTSGSEAVRGSVLQKRYTAGLWRVSAGGAARPQVALGLRAVGPERRGQCRFGARELADKLAPTSAGVQVRLSSDRLLRVLVVRRWARLRTRCRRSSWAWTGRRGVSTRSCTQTWSQRPRPRSSPGRNGSTRDGRTTTEVAPVPRQGAL